MTPCIDVVGYQHFGGPRRLHLHPHNGSSIAIWIFYRSENLKSRFQLSLR